MASLTRRVKVTDFGPEIVCYLCSSYLIDAFTVVECLHSFCKSCILSHVKYHSSCPKCGTQLNAARLEGALRPDQVLQTIVYKLVPNLFASEMKRRRDFYSGYEKRDRSLSPERKGEVCSPYFVFRCTDKISLCIQYHNCSISNSFPSQSLTSPANVKDRYFSVSSQCTLLQLRKVLAAKCPSYDLDQIYIYTTNMSISDDMTLNDIAFLVSWDRKSPLKLYYTYLTKNTHLQTVEIKQSNLDITAINKKRVYEENSIDVPPMKKPICISSLSEMNMQFSQNPSLIIKTSQPIAKRIICEDSGIDTDSSEKSVQHRINIAKIKNSYDVYDFDADAEEESAVYLKTSNGSSITKSIDGQVNSTTNEIQKIHQSLSNSLSIPKYITAKNHSSTTLKEQSQKCATTTSTFIPRTSIFNTNQPNYATDLSLDGSPRQVNKTNCSFKAFSVPVVNVTPRLDLNLCKHRSTISTSVITGNVFGRAKSQSYPYVSTVNDIWISPTSIISTIVTSTTAVSNIDHLTNINVTKLQASLCNEPSLSTPIIITSVSSLMSGNQCHDLTSKDSSNSKTNFSHYSTANTSQMVTSAIEILSKDTTPLSISKSIVSILPPFQFEKPNTPSVSSNASFYNKYNIGSSSAQNKTLNSNSLNNIRDVSEISQNRIKPSLCDDGKQKNTRILSELHKNGTIPMTANQLDSLLQMASKSAVSNPNGTWSLTSEASALLTRSSNAIPNSLRLINENAKIANCLPTTCYDNVKRFQNMVTNEITITKLPSSLSNSEAIHKKSTVKYTKPSKFTKQTKNTINSSIVASGSVSTLHANNSKDVSTNLLHGLLVPNTLDQNKDCQLNKSFGYYNNSAGISLPLLYSNSSTIRTAPKVETIAENLAIRQLKNRFQTDTSEQFNYQRKSDMSNRSLESINNAIVHMPLITNPVPSINSSLLVHRHALQQLASQFSVSHSHLISPSLNFTQGLPTTDADLHSNAKNSSTLDQIQNLTNSLGH